MPSSTTTADTAPPLPEPLTFFLSPPDRRRVLDALRLHHRARAPALLLALGLGVNGRTTKNTENHGDQTQRTG